MLPEVGRKGGPGEVAHLHVHPGRHLDKGEKKEGVRQGLKGEGRAGRREGIFGLMG